MYIKHISFDVWNTLLTPNKEFGLERNKMISRELNIPIETVTQGYKSTKKFLDLLAESTGKCLTTLECWKLLLKYLGVKEQLLYHSTHLCCECNKLFVKYPPHIDQELISVLRSFPESITLSITSNTNFISGEVLNDEIFSDLNIFKYTIYSDLNDNAKPHMKIYNKVIDMIGLTTADWSTERSEILHIGDNIVCDGAAKEQGFQFLLVENPSDLLSKLPTIIESLE